MSCTACTPVLNCPPNDLAPSQGFFATQPFTVVVQCPPGFVCFPGEFPKIITYQPGTIPPVTITLDGSESQMCLLGCQSLICVNVPAGATPAQLQAFANQVFQQWAQQQAQCDTVKNRPQQPLTLPSGCQNTNYNQRLFGGTFEGTVATVIAGPLPAGMFLAGGGIDDVYLAGAPTQAGQYGFQIEYVIGLQTTTRSYLLSVLGITASPAGASDEMLITATIGAAYTVTFSAPIFAVPPLSWQVVAGTLPPGLSLNETTGVLSGTPTGPSASYNFTISLQESAT